MDIELLSFTLDGKNIETAPSKGAYDVSITCNNGAEGYWDYEEWGVEIKNITKQTKCNITFTTGKYFSEYIKDISKSSSNVVKVSHEKTEQTPALEDYRYVGSNPDNYVYFGCSENCTDDNLYRVIGVIPTQSTMDGEYENRVKLVKDKYYTENETGYLENENRYEYNRDTGSNSWSESPINKKVLNDIFWNSLGEYQGYIEQAKWYLGAPLGDDASIYTSDNLYNLERSTIRGKSGGAISYINNIGLIHPSDFGFTVESKYRDKSINANLEIFTKSWMTRGKMTISPESHLAATGQYGTIHWIISGSKSEFLNCHHTKGGSGSYIYPTFYLSADVQYKNGDGTRENPYCIKKD